MAWFRIHSLKHGIVDVEADNWLAALGIGLARLQVAQDLGHVACETLPNGHILVRDVRSGAGYAVVPIRAENALEDEPTNEVDLLPIPEEAIETSVHVEEYAANVQQAVDAGDAIRRTLAAMRAVAPAESGAVLRRHTDGWMGFEGAFGPTADRLQGLVIPPGTGVAGASVEHGLAVSLRDAYADARFFRQIDAYTGYITRSLVSLPLISHGITYGCVQLLNAESPNGFSREQIADAERLSQALAARLALEPLPTPPAQAGR